MHFGDSIHILTQRWLIVAATTTIIFLSALVFISLQANTHEAKATPNMKTHISFIVNEKFVRAIDTLSRRGEINGAYADVAGSKAHK